MYSLRCMLRGCRSSHCSYPVRVQVGAFEEWEIDPDDLQIEKTADGRDLQLGAGGFGMVGYVPQLLDSRHASGLTAAKTWSVPMWRFSPWPQLLTLSRKLA